MAMKRIITSLLLLALPLVALAQGGPLDDKSPAYFVDRYGPAKESRTASKANFFHPASGTETVERQFSVRSFRNDTLRVEATFFLPSLKAAEVRLSLPQQWTQEQIDAALGAYGNAWNVESRSLGINVWRAPDGSRAVLILNSLHFQSLALVDLIEASRASRVAKKKAVPKF